MPSRCLVPLVLVAMSSFGCAAAQPAEQEDSSQSAVSTTGDSDHLAKIERKLNECEELGYDDETFFEKLVTGRFALAAEAYVYVTCTVSATGDVASATVEIEQRAGLSSEDGPFTESGLRAETSLDIPLAVVSATGAVAFEQTIRATAEGVSYSRETSVGVGIEKELGVVNASVVAEFTKTEARVIGSVESSLRVPIALCQGSSGKLGVAVELSATPVANEGVDPKLEAKALTLVDKYYDNLTVYNAPTVSTARSRALCCQTYKTCEKS